MNNKIAKILATVGLLISPLMMSKALSANASITVSSTSGTVIVGTKINVNFKISSAVSLGAWDLQLSTPSNFTLNSCTNSQLAHQVGVVTNSTTKSATITCSFTAKSTGSGTFTVKNYQVEGYSEGTLSTTVSGKTIKVITQEELENSYSKNNNLKSLSISGYELTPAFSKDTLIYSVELPPETYKITVDGAKEDSTATVEGLGEKELVDGLNTITITVTAQNKSTKNYTLNITVKELEPIIVKIGDNEFTVVRKTSEIKKPNDYFEASNIEINGKDVPTLINSKTNTTLVGLKNTKGEINLYIYDAKNNNYTEFKNIDSDKISLEIIDNKGEISDKYKKQEITIKEKKYTVYKENIKDRYSLFMGKNLLTGEVSIYMYDELDSTIQRYNKEEINKLDEEYNNSKEISTYIIIGLTGILLLTYITILTKITKGKRSEKPLIKKKEKEDNNIEDNEKEKPQELVQDMEEELDFFDRKAKKKKK